VLALPLSARAMGPADSPSAAHYEVHFLSHMIHHHFMGVEMGMMCMEKAIHPELQTLCQHIVTSQQHEIEQMQMWLHHWYDVHMHEMQMSKKDQTMMDLLASLQGEEFEMEFLEMMVEHHAVAVKDSGKCLRKAEHDEVLNLCASIESVQRAEIDQMEGWLCQWYGKCY
jgi:uncharacterized protein (DUF305 family)